VFALVIGSWDIIIIPTITIFYIPSQCLCKQVNNIMYRAIHVLSSSNYIWFSPILFWCFVIDSGKLLLFYYIFNIILATIDIYIYIYMLHANTSLNIIYYTQLNTTVILEFTMVIFTEQLMYTMWMLTGKRIKPILK